jgi:lysyl-tRNA synthetase class 1
MVPGMDAELFQFQVYEVGKRHDFQPLRSWFQALYECLLGSDSGPRFGAFTAAYGLKNTIALLRQYENIDA